MSNKPFVITFAGVPGSSKSIIAFYLSTAFSLPIFSTDNLRYEVKEDLLVDDIRQPQALNEFERRQTERFTNILNKKISFIRDGSVDRRWAEVKKQLVGANYKYCLIDMELSRDFLIKLYTKTGRKQALEELDIYLKQHARFIKSYQRDITFRITDDLFKDRIDVAKTSVKKFMEKSQTSI